ncbi:MAG: hypothetical protein USCGTAYLOR_02627 [Chromatiales bacterium USCg_Taylor]|nr:MAG: hypothetical protein USCGTAYLOR_02627 [Chromatiales bacterium USCg_Taylor]
MLHRLSFVLFGMLVSCTAFATGSIRCVSAAIPPWHPDPRPSKPNACARSCPATYLIPALSIDTEFSYSVQTVGHALNKCSHAVATV